MQVILSEEEYINLRNQIPADFKLQGYVKKETVKQAFSEFVAECYKDYRSSNYGLDYNRITFDRLVEKFCESLDKKETV